MKLICIGDSQTFCLGLHRADKWSTLLGENTGWEVINAGINGDTSGGVLARLRPDVIDKKPDIVLVMCGGNDFIMGADMGTVKANTMAIVQQCLAAGIKVVIASELMLYPELVSEEYNRIADFHVVNERMREITAWYPDFCNAFPGVSYINLQKLYLEETGGSAEYSADGLHPNKEGAKIIAKILTNEFYVL